VLDHLGLQAAVQWFAQRMEKRTGVACQVNADDFELDGELATFAFRAVQELLTNVLRHAGATRAWIRVRQPQEGGVRVEVEDNGRGLDEEHAFSGRSFGLSEVRERAHALGGTLTIERAASGGARVVIAIPARAGTRNKEA
jgi:signal transduction histidine kinase